MSNGDLRRLWLEGVPAKKIAIQLDMASEHYVYCRARVLGLPGRKVNQGDPVAVVLRMLRDRRELICRAIEAIERARPIADRLRLSNQGSEE